MTKWVLWPDLVLGAEGSSGGCQVFTRASLSAAGAQRGLQRRVPTGTECVRGDDLFHASFQWGLDLASPHAPFASIPGQSSPQAQNLPGLASW